MHQRNPLQLHQQQQRLRLQAQIKRQKQKVQGRVPTFSAKGDNKPRSVQRQESQKIMNLQNYERLFGVDLTDGIDDMWEDPLYTDLHASQLDSFQADQRFNFNLGPQTSTPNMSRQLIHQNSLKLNFPYSSTSHLSDQGHWNPSKCSTPTSSLIQSSMGQSRLLLDSRLSLSGREDDDDFATQFLESPMFDSLKSRRGWGVRRKGKYSLYGGGSSLATRCIIM